MRNFLFFIIVLLATLKAAAQPINIYYTVGVGPNFGLVPSMINTLEHANASQTKYKFTLDFKPGANGLLAVRALDRDPVHRVVGVGPHFLRHVENGTVALRDYAPVEHTGYDICTGVVATVGNSKAGLDSLEVFRGKTVTVGTLSPASPAYTTAVELSKRYGFVPKFVAFNSDDEGFMAMVGNHGINFAFNSPRKFLKYSDQNPNMQLLAVHCPSRVATVPDVPTLAEHGIHVPEIFNMLLTKTAMPATQRQEIGKIIDASQNAVNLWAKMPHLKDATAPNWHWARLNAQHTFMTSKR